MSVLTDFNKLLPQSDVPKFHPFPDRKETISLVRALSDFNSKGRAHVFEVSIGSKEYALKMFYDDEMDRTCLIDEKSDLLSADLLRAHMDPFFNECRAYGRLEEQLSRKFDIQAWDRPEEDCAKPVSQRQAFRAVVKKLIREPVQLTQKVTKKILKDLETMRKLGVYPMDVCARNYEAELLVDMGIAMTTPHYLFNIRPSWQVRVMQREDLLMFDKMIKDEEVNTWIDERCFISMTLKAVVPGEYQARTYNVFRRPAINNVPKVRHQKSWTAPVAALSLLSKGGPLVSVNSPMMPKLGNRFEKNVDTASELDFGPILLVQI
ncbi:MAG: hypothetical protein Q9161_003000 [Pseudevernia consocians]